MDLKSGSHSDLCAIGKNFPNPRAERENYIENPDLPLEPMLHISLNSTCPSIVLVEPEDTNILLKTASWQSHGSDLEVNEPLRRKTKTSF